MRVVFLGTPELAVPSLAVIAGRHEVAAVACQPDKPQGRSARPVPPPTKVWAERNGIPVRQPAKLNNGSFESWLRALRPDAGVVVAYGRLLRQPILDVPPLGWLNMHPSLLPRWRGPSPIQTALMTGDTETGVSIMRLTLDMDAGDILLKERTPIDPAENAVTLSARLAELGAHLLADALERLESGRAVFSPQPSDGVTYCKMIAKGDGRIRWAKPAREIHNLVRAAVPWPVAHCLWHGEVCRIHRSDSNDAETDAVPGTVTSVQPDRVLVATGHGQLAILEFQAPGKRPMAMSDYLRGHTIRVGERFEDVAA